MTQQKKNQEMPRKTMDQHRAAFALEAVEAWRKALHPDQADEIARYLNGLPALVHMNGLGQALAFCRMKDAGKEGPYHYIYKHVSDWLCKEELEGHIFSGHKDVLEAITASDMRLYMAAQGEALALLSWTKKFASTFLKKDKRGGAPS